MSGQRDGRAWTTSVIFKLIPEALQRHLTNSELHFLFKVLGAFSKRHFAQRKHDAGATLWVHLLLDSVKLCLAAGLCPASV